MARIKRQNWVLSYSGFMSSGVFFWTLFIFTNAELGNFGIEELRD
jgi:hypothetical protein